MVRLLRVSVPSVRSSVLFSPMARGSSWAVSGSRWLVCWVMAW